VGAELYGHAGLEADLEVVDLLLRSLQAAGVERVRIDLGHVGLVRTLLARVQGMVEDDVFPLLQAKDAPALRALLEGGGDGSMHRALLALPGLFGPAGDVIARARAELPASREVDRALDELERLAEALVRMNGGGGPALEIALDLADARGYRYHGGVIFAAYVDGVPDAIGRGGRYDNVGAAFGRARPATGFSIELRELAQLVPDDAPSPAIRAPWALDASLAAAVRALRDRGEIVVQVLPGHEHEQQEFQCDRELVRADGHWVIRPMGEG
jgi:ATP phosphoribosyltransferase regulatory subunit